MTIDEAIELIEDVIKSFRHQMTPANTNALKLGIEALRQIDLARRSRDIRIIDHIPGETTE